MNRNYFVLTEAQFARLKPLLPTDTWGKPRVDDRRVISGIVHVLKSGCRWVDAPPIYSEKDPLQSLPALGRQGCLGRHLPCPGLDRLPAGAGHHRLLGGKGPSLCIRRQRGEQNQAIGARRPHDQDPSVQSAFLIRNSGTPAPPLASTTPSIAS
jgi:hypothetical protein